MRVGVEHEYRLWRGGVQLDFRTLVGRVADGLRSLDPGDPRARRLPSGAALTADGWEAELASPPVELDTDSPAYIDALLRAERTELREASRLVGADGLTGFSTHLNLGVDDARVVTVGRAFAEHCLAALSEAMEPSTSAGLFVRPRRGRLEVGGEYAEGEDLGAALVLFAACVDLLDAGEVPPDLDPPALVPSREKFGWYAAVLPLGQLPTVWEWARPAAAARGLDLAALDHLASGRRRLRRERAADPTACTFGSLAPAPGGPVDVGRRRLGRGVVAETEWLTWDHAVWLFEDRRGRQCRAVVPAQDEARFLDELRAGEHDDVVHRMLRRRWRPSRLQRHAQLHGLSWWHDLRPGALVPAERLPDGSVPTCKTPRDAYGAGSTGLL